MVNHLPVLYARLLLSMASEGKKGDTGTEERNGGGGGVHSLRRQAGAHADAGAGENLGERVRGVLRVGSAAWSSMKTKRRFQEQG